MKTYKVALTRTYLVTINATDEEKAKKLSEYFIGDCPDSSNEKYRSEFNFSIENIEMMYNEAGEILDIDD